MVSICRSSFRYESRPRDDDELAKRLRDIAKRKKRYGYRRAWALLRREGLKVNRKRVYRIWRERGLCLPRRRRKKPRYGNGAVPCEAVHAGHVWTYDFIHDACHNGRKLKILTVIDEFTRECLAIETETSLPSKKVIALLQRLITEHDAPEFLRSDNGPEFIAKLIRQWLAERGLQTLYIDPGSPWQNAYGESFHSRLRDECLSMEVFASFAEAKVVIEAWRREYNEERPHSSLDYLTPAEFKAL